VAMELSGLNRNFPLTSFMKKLSIYNFVHRVFPLFFVAPLLTACRDTDSSKTNTSVQQKSVPPSLVQYKKPAASFNDTLVITKVSAVFYYPDSLQLDKIKASSKKNIMKPRSIIAFS
jgi:hypothetical protein